MDTFVVWRNEMRLSFHFVEKAEKLLYALCMNVLVFGTYVYVLYTFVYRYCIAQVYEGTEDGIHNHLI